MAERTRTTAKTQTTYTISNNTSADIIIPRANIGRIIMNASPDVIPAGRSLEVRGEDWVGIRQKPIIQRYIERGLISEIKKGGMTGAVMDRTSAPQIPEHLLRPEETGNTGMVAKVSRSRKSTITVD